SATSAPISVHVNQPVAVLASAGTVGCDGKVKLTASASGGTGSYPTFEWFDGGSSIGTGSPLTATLVQDGKDNSITVKVTDSAGCSVTSASTSVHVNQPVAVSVSAGTPGCTDPMTGKAPVTLTASASRGAGGYTFEWFDGTTSIGTDNPL